uniref:YkgJ family cysteine cluster protein n=1 Tax=Strongyloides papillosus TaxID=174720 RepID=A0A0N5BC36_STREA
MNESGKIKISKIISENNKRITIIPPPTATFCCMCGKKCYNFSKILKKEDNDSVFERIFHILNVQWPSIRDRCYNKKLPNSTLSITEVAKKV